MNYLTNPFILELKAKLNETVEFYDGEYDSFRTNWARFRVLNAAEPNTAEDIVAYVMYLESLNAIQNTKIREHLNRIIKLFCIGNSTEQVQAAIDILSKYERPKGFFNRLFKDHTKKFDKGYNPFHDLSRNI